MVYVEENIKKLFRTMQPEGRAKYVRLDQNENPDGLPKWFFDSVMSEVTPSFISMYPEEGVFISKYAKYLGVNENQLCITDGSVTAMGYVVRVFGNPKKNFLSVTPTFGMYKVYTDMIGMNNIQVPYEKDFTFKIETILNAIDENTGLVCLVNPNMPMGNVYEREDIIKVIEKARKYDATVIIDEAYYYFYDKTSIDLVDKYDNVVLLRTFSKLFTLAGLRLGVVISNPQLTQYVNNLKPHYTVNCMALLFSERIIDNVDRLTKELEDNFNTGKDYVLKRLNENNYEVLPSHGCFICIKAKNKTAEQIAQELKDKYNILILIGKGELSNYLRLTICNIKYMKLFMDALFEIDK